ncbi:hypothetical protein Bhyg_09386 [Pseudolycoriella hygida]|uniref:Uncharacterized protein n=1 Tax=Pseudolycoriella hygida TaxID=35572 RepID=A0A9Q0N742_9DIPT|nr:hypothetical protein Bhyg_09386 [Pseudolycoriella hygida]
MQWALDIDSLRTKTDRKFYHVLEIPRFFGAATADFSEKNKKLVYAKNDRIQVATSEDIGDVKTTY